jgi:hypothetical protein
VTNLGLGHSTDSTATDVNSHGLSGLEKCEPHTWLLEEYTLLSEHYFHEDNYFQYSMGGVQRN